MKWNNYVVNCDGSQGTLAIFVGTFFWIQENRFPFLKHQVDLLNSTSLINILKQREIRQCAHCDCDALWMYNFQDGGEDREITQVICFIFRWTYSQLSPCGHPAITNTPIIRTAAKSPAKTSCRRLTEINSRYYGLSLMRTLTRGPNSVRYKGSWL